MFELRDYQVSAIEAALNWIKYKPDESGFITAAGGAGKSVMIAKIAEAVCDMGRRVVILARNEKLLRQNKAKISPSYDVVPVLHKHPNNTKSSPCYHIKPLPPSCTYTII